jgi:flagella basal body P-ring formation protein FlgA
VRVSTGAQALEDGRMGSIITVRASHTRERLRARVTGAGVVAALEE